MCKRPLPKKNVGGYNTRGSVTCQVYFYWVSLKGERDVLVSTYSDGATNDAGDVSGTGNVDGDTEAVRGFYDRIVAYEWKRLEHYVLENATVQHYFSRYLPPPPARIVDIGGGPGRYALMLAQQGYEVTLIDLSPSNVAWAREQFAQAGVQAYAELGDARNLRQFAAGQFDAALLLGPLYHLPKYEDRHQAVSEMRRVLRLGGRAFTMMLTRAAAIYEGFNRWPEGILDREGVQQLLTAGSGFNFEKNPSDFEGVYFAHPSEVLPLHEALNLRTYALVGCEGVLGGRRAEIERMTPEVQVAWIQLVLQVCEDPSILGASERLLYVGEAV